MTLKMPVGFITQRGYSHLLGYRLDQNAKDWLSLPEESTAGIE